VRPSCRNGLQFRRAFSAMRCRRKTVRILGIWLLSCALLVNSWALQSHVHHDTDGDEATVHVSLAGAGHSDADSKPTKGRIPCPLCQQLALGGLTSLPPFLPAILALQRPLAAARRLEEEALPVAAPQAHHWLSRGPPLL